MKRKNREPLCRVVGFLLMSVVIGGCLCISAFAKYPNSLDWINGDPEGELLSGEFFGTEAYGSGENVFDLAFDGNTETFFDSLSGGAFTTWAGVELESPARLTEFRWMPREAFADRSVGACIQGSTDGVKWTTIYTIGEIPEFEYVSVSSDYFDTDEFFTMFRYTQSTDTHLDVAEIEFYGLYEASLLSTDAENSLEVIEDDAADDKEAEAMAAITAVLVVLVLLLAGVNILMKVMLQKRKNAGKFK